ncbi:MAG: response regulator [Thermodesulfovibrionales bacterium]|nr:response regulator [Thermodesulfovibrionales bacterium]
MKKILISDSLKHLVSGENILSRANTQILTASSSQEILSIHKSEKADLVVIDLDMPGMSGDELCSLLRKEPDPNLVKVLIAVEPQETDIKRAEQCGANTYITKPINSPLFFSKIASLLDVKTRKAYRMPVKATVAGEMGNVKLTASAINISSTGILIESAHPLNVGEAINCSFLLPGTLAISVNGEVIRIIKKPAGSIHQYGIRFTSISASAQRIIEDFVKSRFEPPV